MLQYSSTTLYFTLAYTLFIIYGSLVPLDYHPIQFEKALQSFEKIRYLNLGAASRADWIANIILYIPLTFSFAAYFISKTRLLRIQTIVTSILILSFSITLAVTIEFYQQFFPPRTVSQNDLIAETMGSVIGLALWFGYGKKLRGLVTHIIQGGKNALLAGAILYILGYLFISFFPYDFITSYTELANKLAKGNDALFISNSCGGIVRCTSKLISEIALTIPLGILVSAVFKWHPQRLMAVILIGFVFGAIIESIQLFLISGIAQGLSIIMRMTGMALGEKLYKNLTIKNLSLHVYRIKKYIPFMLAPYLFLLASLNGWSLIDLQLTDNIAEQLNNINWLPFYYHYYSTESVALNSLLSIIIMYLPVGLGLWLWRYRPNNHKTNAEIKAGVYAVILCFIMETSKLFLASKHPDPTNLLISFFAAFIIYKLANLVVQWFQQPELSIKNTENITEITRDSQPYAPGEQAHSLQVITQGTPLAKIIALILIALLVWKIIDYPESSLLLTMGMLLYGLLLRYYPQFWLLAIPTLLPILNFSPWTGRFFFSEFDYLILLTLASGLWYGRYTSPFQHIKPSALFLFTIYSVFYLISLLKGLFPLQDIDANAFSNYHSHYNSIRVAKGFIWSILLLPMLIYNHHLYKNSTTWLGYGILSGLTATIFFTLVERYTFTGLFDYESDFRITATFYSMHTGGAHIDAYLILTLPFIFLLFNTSSHKLLKSIFALILFSGSLYSIMVTFSRGTYIALVFVAFTLIIGFCICYKQQLKSNWKQILWVPLLITATAVIATPILQGSFIQNRFKQAYQEAGFRSSHWKASYEMMDDDWLTLLTGMGLGSFPRAYLWRNLEAKAPATYRVEQEKQQTYLKLGSGAPLYIEQKINITANTRYKLTLDYRIYSIDSRLNIQICEKAIQHSFLCQGVPVIPKIMTTDWQHYEQTINTQNIGKNNRFTARPIKLILTNHQKNASIDVTNLSLNTSKQSNIIKNSDFSKGMDHWFFSADDHAPWRTENQWIQILFEQGWIGLILFSVLLSYVFIHLYQQLLKQDIYSVIIASSFIGFLVISIIDSPFDMPRIALLFYILLFTSLLPEKSETT